SRGRFTSGSTTAQAGVPAAKSTSTPLARATGARSAAAGPSGCVRARLKWTMVLVVPPARPEGWGRPGQLLEVERTLGAPDTVPIELAARPSLQGAPRALWPASPGAREGTDVRRSLLGGRAALRLERAARLACG